jgi:hypothetical protein
VRDDIPLINAGVLMFGSCGATSKIKRHNSLAKTGIRNTSEQARAGGQGRGRLYFDGYIRLPLMHQHYQWTMTIQIGSNIFNGRSDLWSRISRLKPLLQNINIQI